MMLLRKLYVTKAQTSSREVIQRGSEEVRFKVHIAQEAFTSIALKILMPPRGFKLWGFVGEGAV